MMASPSAGLDQTSKEGPPAGPVSPNGPLPSPHPPRKQPVFADLQDWQVLEDGHEIGRIYEQHAPASPDQGWFWLITVLLDMRAKVVRSGRAPTIDQAKQDFLKSWSAWTAWLSR